MVCFKVVGGSGDQTQVQLLCRQRFDGGPKRMRRAGGQNYMAGSVEYAWVKGRVQTKQELGVNDDVEAM